MQPRIHGFPEHVQAPLWIFDNDSVLKSHRSYKSAKSGNMNAAVRLVSDLAFQFLKDSCKKIPPGACFVAPHAREATGNNAIPQVLATAAATLANGTTDLDIVQIHQVFHTGADPMERLAARPEFEGLVTPEIPHVLVDDVTTMGGTLADLANYIISHGGDIVAVIVLVNAGRDKNLRPTKTITNKIKTRYGHHLEALLGIQPDALTANEANYLIGFRSPDEIRNRLAKAREETHRRLRSKGILG
jgi:hypothetical protein